MRQKKRAYQTKLDMLSIFCKRIYAQCYDLNRAQRHVSGSSIRVFKFDALIFLLFFCSICSLTAINPTNKNYKYHSQVVH